MGNAQHQQQQQQQHRTVADYSLDVVQSAPLPEPMMQGDFEEKAVLLVRRALEQNYAMLQPLQQQQQQQDVAAAAAEVWAQTLDLSAPGPAHLTETVENAFRAMSLAALADLYALPLNANGIPHESGLKFVRRYFLALHPDRGRTGVQLLYAATKAGFDQLQRLVRIAAADMGTVDKTEYSLVDFDRVVFSAPADDVFPAAYDPTSHPLYDPRFLAGWDTAAGDAAGAAEARAGWQQQQQQQQQTCIAPSTEFGLSAFDDTAERRAAALADMDIASLREHRGESSAWVGAISADKYAVVERSAAPARFFQGQRIQAASALVAWSGAGGGGGGGGGSGLVKTRLDRAYVARPEWAIVETEEWNAETSSVSTVRRVAIDAVVRADSEADARALFADMETRRANDAAHTAPCNIQLQPAIVIKNMNEAVGDIASANAPGINYPARFNKRGP